MTTHDRWPVAVTAARLIAVTGLGIDAYVHLDLASDLLRGPGSDQ